MHYLIQDYDADCTYEPAVILSFDEAHTLTVVEKDEIDGSWSKFSELRRALRAIRTYPCFSIFLSATGKVQQFTPDSHNDTSLRLQEGVLTLIPSFCELGFDHFAERAISGETTLEHVASLKFMVRLGRPLWVSHLSFNRLF
jgi:hypothetical protein